MIDNDINNQNNNNNKSENNLEKNKKEFTKKIGSYVLLNEIGTGTFSKVAKAFHIITDQEVAVKILQKEKIKDEIDIERILREIEILKKVIHPNICQLYETYSTVHNFYLMMEHITGGDLFDYITSNDYLSEIQSCIFFRQLISVIEYLNELGISHRDLKPENILLDKNHQNIKLIDFGLSNYYSDKKLLKSSCGSPCYASPEMLSGRPYLGITTDLWSAGIVLYSMLVGSLPFDDQELYELYKQIKLGKFYLPSTLSLEAIDLLKRLLNVDPTKRIGLEEIKNHKWFQMDEYPLYRGINISKEKLGYNLDTINYVCKNFFGKENDLDYISKNEFIDMIRNYHCNKYTATYYLTKKYILKIDDTDIIFKKESNEKKEDVPIDKMNETTNMKYDKKIYKMLINDSNSKNEDKNKFENFDKKPNNNYIIKNNINLEIKREGNKKDDYNYDNNNLKKSNIELENKELLFSEIDASGQKAKVVNEEIYKNNLQKKNKIELSKDLNKIQENIGKKNFKKNELYLNNIKNTNLKTHYRNSIEIKQKKFTKNLLLKGESKTKDNIITNINNTNMNNNTSNCYIVKTWGNNSINHISKNNKITFGNSSHNKPNNLNYNNFLYHNYNSNYNSYNGTKNRNENSSSVNSYKTNKKQKPTSKKVKTKDKEKNQKNNGNNNNSYNNKMNYISNNKYSLSSSKQKENNFNFYLINNYINQNEIKNNKNNCNIGKMPNSTKNDDSTDSNINFSQYYFIKSRKYNILKTIDLPGSYTSRYNTEINNKKLQNLNNNLKPYNKIRVNLKTDNNKLNETNSPKNSENKSNNVTKKPSLAKSTNNNFNNNKSHNKSNDKKNCTLKLNEIKNNITKDEQKKLLNSFSVKKKNSIVNNPKYLNSYSNSNTKANNNKIQYQLYYSNETKLNNTHKTPSTQYGNILNSNLKNICLKPKGIYLKNRTKSISRRNSSNQSIKGKNNILIKENTLNNNNCNYLMNKNLDNNNKSDIYNRKKITNNSSQRNNFKNYIFKELFPIEEDDLFDIKCHFNTKKLKNKILLLNEECFSNKYNSPKECYSFNDSGFNSIYHSDVNIMNKKKVKEGKIKQNFSNIYNRKKNLIIKTEQNSSGEKIASPQSKDKTIKYIYKSKLSLY